MHTVIKSLLVLAISFAVPLASVKGQVNTIVPHAGIIELTTRSFNHPDLNNWFKENSKILQRTNYIWGRNKSLQELILSDHPANRESRKVLEDKANQLSDRLGMLHFGYFDFHQASIFEQKDKVDKLREQLVDFIRSRNGVNYQGKLLLAIASLDKSGNVVFYQGKDSGISTDYEFDKISLEKKIWLDQWLSDNNASITTKTVVTEFEKRLLPQKEPPPIEISVLTMPSNLDYDENRYGKFDLGYGTLRNLKWGGFFMEALEKGQTELYIKETTRLGKSIKKALKQNKTDIVALKGSYLNKAPIFTSILHNPPKNWYERTYYRINQETGVEIVLQVQIEFEEGSANGAIKNIFLSRGDRANYRNYCRFVLFDQEAPIPLAPVYEMEIDWKQKRIKENK